MHQNQIGVPLATDVNWGQMVREGGEFPDKYSGINSSKVCNSNIHIKAIK